MSHPQLETSPGDLVYYRRRWRVETTFRFLQRDGLRWDDFKVLNVDAIQRLITLVLIAALFLLNIHHFLHDTSLQILLT